MGGWVYKERFFNIGEHLYIIYMEFPAEVKQALKELPPPERVVAIALKNVYEQIRLLNVQEKQDIDNNRLKYLNKFKEIEQQVFITFIYRLPKLSKAKNLKLKSLPMLMSILSRKRKLICPPFLKKVSQSKIIGLFH